MGNNCCGNSVQPYWELEHEAQILPYFKPDNFIQRLNHSKIFQLHPDWDSFTKEDIQWYEMYGDQSVKLWVSELREFLTQKFLNPFHENSDDHQSMHQSLNVIENKLRTQKYLHLHNKHYQFNPNVPEFIPTLPIYQIFYQDELNDTEIDTKLQEVLPIINSYDPQTKTGGAILKPCYQAFANGFSPLNFGHEGAVRQSPDGYDVDALKEELRNAFDPTDEAIFHARFSPCPHPRDKAIIIQKAFRDHFEVKLWIIFGKVSHGVVIYSKATDSVYERDVWEGTITYNGKCVGCTVEKVQLLNLILPEELYNSMVYKSELMAMNLGLYQLRCDWFINGDGKALYFNEFAFPNAMEIARGVTWPCIVAEILKRKEDLWKRRNTRSLFYDEREETSPEDMLWD